MTKIYLKLQPCNTANTVVIRVNTEFYEWWGDLFMSADSRQFVAIDRYGIPELESVQIPIMSPGEKVSPGVVRATMVDLVSRLDFTYNDAPFVVCEDPDSPQDLNTCVDACVNLLSQS